jgi:hypothetical protein
MIGVQGVHGIVGVVLGFGMLVLGLRVRGGRSFTRGFGLGQDAEPVLSLHRLVNFMAGGRGGDDRRS